MLPWRDSLHQGDQKCALRCRQAQLLRIGWQVDRGQEIAAAREQDRRDEGIEGAFAQEGERCLCPRHGAIKRNVVAGNRDTFLDEVDSCSTEDAVGESLGAKLAKTRGSSAGSPQARSRLPYS